jgi:hypothetical protein
MRHALVIIGFIAVGSFPSPARAGNCASGECHLADGTCVAVSASACSPKQDTYVCVDCTALAGACRTATCETPGYTCGFTNKAAGTNCGSNMACDGFGVCKCTGCIDDAGVCQAGTSATACGTAGGRCRSCDECASGASCSSGVCSGGTAQNEGLSCWNGSGTCHAGGCCTTCWNGTSCVSSTSSTSCGSGGGPCTNCNDCKTGTTSCNAGVCTGGTAAADGTTCSGGSGTCRGNGQCCTGCWDGVQCRTPSGDACGAAGSLCTNCNDCRTGATCSAGACSGGTAVTDGATCVGTAGTCHSGTCCSGCWDGSTCQAGTADTSCGGGGETCQDCGACQIGATCTGGACTNGANKPDGTVCSGTYACCNGLCNFSGGTCCSGPGMCLNSLGVCVDGTQVSSCGTNGSACQDCSASDDCGNAGTCSAGGCVSGTSSTPPSACYTDFAATPPTKTVWCDYGSVDHCTAVDRDVATTDCRGKLTHDAYPGGFTPEGFDEKSGVTITTSAIVPTGTGSPAGWVVSRNLSKEISTWASDEQQWTLSRVHVRVTGTRSGTCNASSDYVALYLSLGETTYHGTGAARKPVPIQITPLPAGTEGVLPFLVQTKTTSGGFVAEQVYDILTWGHAGTRLRWGATFYRLSSGCTLAITNVQLGYQAMQNELTDSSDGVYKLRSYSSLIPLANMMYFGALETPGGASEWPGASGGDRAPRGHLIAQSFYDPADPTSQVITKQWDAGEELNLQQPRYRRIFSSDGAGARMEVSAANSTLPQLVIPGFDRAAKDASGNLVHDFDHSGAVDDQDAVEVINWTRGCALGTSATCDGATPTTRPWLLGAIDRSTPAIVGPPNMPWWLNGQKIPAQLRTDYWTWAADATRSTRDTIAYVGAQDGMIHAFYAGQYKLGDDATTTPVERRGYFVRADATSPRDYGGRDACRTRHAGPNASVAPYPEACPERFAYVPRALLGNLRNNVTTWSGESWTWQPANHPRAGIESSPMVEDIARWDSTTSTWKFRTTLFSGIGPISPYLIALDVTDPSEPTPLWERTYANFRGTLKAPPTAAFAHVPVAGSNVDRHILVMTSGFGWNLWDPYALIIDAWTGDEIVPGGVRLNADGRPASFGTFGSPLMLDMEGDGFVDRAYILDTGRDATGTLFTRVVRLSIRPTLDNTSTTNPQVCEVFYATGEGAFGGLGGYVCDGTDPTAPCTTPKVRLYFATSDDPRWDDGSSDGATGPNHLYAIDDTDLEPPDTEPERNPTCTPGNHTLQFNYQLESGERSWLTPAIDYQYVYFATVRTPTDSECDWATSLGGRLLTFDLDGSGTVKTAQNLSVQPVGSIRVYDQHVFMGTSAGTPTITAPSGTGFNNTPQSIAGQSKVEDDYWIEQ